MLPSAIIVVRGYIYNVIVLTSGVYSIVNLLTSFLGCQMSKEEPAPLLAIKMWNFYTTLI